LWQLELTTQFRVTLFVGCKRTKPEYGPHFRQTQKVNHKSVTCKYTLCLNVLYQPLMDTCLDGSVCKLHIPQLVLVLSWPHAAHNNPICGALSGGSTQHKSIGSFAKNSKFPVPTNIVVDF